MNEKIVLLGFLQGLTEFLPVSSSGHLALAQNFCGIDNASAAYDIVLHIATMLATLIFFCFDIYYLVSEWLSGFVSDAAKTKEGWRTGWAVIFATIITGIIGIAMKPVVETVLQKSLFVGLGLLVTGALLIASHFIKEGYGHVRPADGIIVGIAQGIATLPGVSRSGMTILAGCRAGLSRDEAFRLSFLVSIPAICGATLLEAFDLGGFGAFCAALPNGWFWGASAAFLSGLFALFILKKLVINAKWWIFGIYCLLLGLISVGVSFFGGIGCVL